MSFADFSNYRFGFNELDAKLKNLETQKKYYDKWMKKYAGIFKYNENSLTSIEWDLRCRKALREIFSSATFLLKHRKL